MTAPPAQILQALLDEQPQGFHVVEVPDGQGTTATVEAMSQLAMEGAHGPHVIQLARDIVSRAPSHDQEGMVQAIFDWVRENVRYTPDPRGMELVQTPGVTAWVAGAGDCDDHAVLVCALAMAVGFGASFRVVATDPSRPDEASHVYALVGFRSEGGPKWVALDTTRPNEPIGWEPPPDRVMGLWDFPLAAA